MRKYTDSVCHKKKTKEKKKLFKIKTQFRITNLPTFCTRSLWCWKLHNIFVTRPVNNNNGKKKDFHRVYTTIQIYKKQCFWNNKMKIISRRLRYTNYSNKNIHILRMLHLNKSSEMMSPAKIAQFFFLILSDLVSKIKNSLEWLRSSKFQFYTILPWNES